MFWGVKVNNKTKFNQTVEHTYHVSMAVLEPPAAGQGKKPVELWLEREKERHLICVLTEQHMNQPMDLLCFEGEELSYSIKGEGTIHLTGYLLPPDDDDEGLEYDDEEMSDEDTEEIENMLKAKLEGKNKRKNTDAAEAPAQAMNGKKAKVDPGSGKKGLQGKVMVDNDSDMDSDELEAMMKMKKFAEDDDDDDEDDSEDFDSDDDEDDDSSEEATPKLKQLQQQQKGGKPQQQTPKFTPKPNQKEQQQKSAKKTPQPGNQQQQKGGATPGKKEGKQGQVPPQQKSPLNQSPNDSKASGKKNKNKKKNKQFKQSLSSS